MYVVKINGVRHEVTTDDHGNTIYDPPLSRDRRRRDKQKLSDMLSSGKSPGLQTDTGFHAGRGTLLNQMEGDEVWCKYLAQEARKQGYSPGANDVYIGQLADRAGDPKAWFKPGEGRAELKKRLEASGKGVDMPGLSVQAKPHNEADTPALNPRLVKQLERQYKRNGMAGDMTSTELKDHIIKTHGRKKSNA